MSLEMEAALVQARTPRRNNSSNSEDSVTIGGNKSGDFLGMKNLFSRPKPQTLEKFLADVPQPKITPYEELGQEQRTKIDALKRKFPQWGEWGYYQGGNIKDVFVARPVFESSPNSIKFAVKMDKTEGEVMAKNPSAAMIQHYRKDYNARREANVSLATTGLQGFAPPIEGRDLSDVGYHGCYAYAEHFVPSASLQQILEQKQTLPTHIAAHYARKMFEQDLAFFQRTGRLHRDLKPSNLLVALGERTGDLILTDTSAAGKPSEAVDQYTHSCPGRKTCDPRLMSSRTGNASKYEQASEVYSLAKVFGMMLLGEDFLPVSPYDPKPFDEQEYDAQLRIALNNLPKEAKQYKSLLYNSLRYDSKRIPSLDELVKRLDEIENPTFEQKVKRNWGSLTSIATGIAIGLSSLGHYAYSSHNKLNETSKLIADTQRTINVGANWNGTSLQPSALFKLKTEAVEYGGLTNYQIYPQQPYLRTKQGRTIHVRPKIIQEALPSEKFLLPFMHCPVQVYLDGVTNIPIVTFGRPFEDPKSVPPRNLPFGLGYQTSAELTIPTNLPSGNYTIIVNALRPKTYNEIKSNDFIINISGDNVLAQERIPIIIGDASHPFFISKIAFSSFENEVNYKSTNFQYGAFQDYDISKFNATYQIPELGMSWTNQYAGRMTLPVGDTIPQGSYTLLMDVIENGTGNRIFQSSFPLSYEPREGYNFPSWNITRPATNYHEKVIAFRSQLKQHSCQRTNSLVDVANTSK